jgi:hypothetical protein
MGSTSDLALYIPTTDHSVGKDCRIDSASHHFQDRVLFNGNALHFIPIQIVRKQSDSVLPSGRSAKAAELYLHRYDETLINKPHGVGPCPGPFARVDNLTDVRPDVQIAQRSLSVPADQDRYRSLSKDRRIGQGQ